MQLQCQLPHMSNQTLVIDGCEYHIDGDGLCSNLSAAHGERLLGQSSAWARVGDASGPRLPAVSLDPQDPTRTVAALELPEGLELTLPKNLVNVPPIRKKRGRPARIVAQETEP